MKIKKAPTNYRIPTWVTICSECGCEYEFTRKDTHLYVHGRFQREYFIQCPYCGKWQETMIE